MVEEYLEYEEPGSLAAALLGTPLVYGGMAWPLLCGAVGYLGEGLFFGVAGLFLGTVSGLPITYFGMRVMAQRFVEILVEKGKVQWGWRAAFFQWKVSASMTSVEKVVVCTTGETDQPVVCLVRDDGDDIFLPLAPDTPVEDLDREGRQVATALGRPFISATETKNGV